jgi:hypothetical protein
MLVRFSGSPFHGVCGTWSVRPMLLLAAGEDDRGVLVDRGRRLGVGEQLVRPVDRDEMIHTRVGERVDTRE